MSSKKAFQLLHRKRNRRNFAHKIKDLKHIIGVKPKRKGNKMKRYTEEQITTLAPNEIFVFGSNIQGYHGGGAARVALNKFGAVWGQGDGLQGQSYAIPTMEGGVETIRPFVDKFIGFARKHPEYTFLVTRIGCGIAGFTDGDIAPLFQNAIALTNIVLPKTFADVLEQTE